MRDRDVTTGLKVRVEKVVMVVSGDSLRVARYWKLNQTGTVLEQLPGSGGDVWEVVFEDGLHLAYRYDEIEPLETPENARLIAARNLQVEVIYFNTELRELKERAQKVRQASQALVAHGELPVELTDARAEADLIADELAQGLQDSGVQEAVEGVFAAFRRHYETLAASISGTQAA